MCKAVQLPISSVDFGRTDPTNPPIDFAKHMEMQTWTRVGQVAKKLGLSTQAVRNLIRSGKLKADKDPEGRWLIDAASADRYLAEYGRRNPAPAGMERVEERLGELARSVESLRESNVSATQLLETTERERDKHRAEASAVREAALRLIGSAQETNLVVAGLLKVLKQQEDALVQLLAPGSLDDLMPLRGERT
jgi:Helix-turn-helix domain